MSSTGLGAGGIGAVCANHESNPATAVCHRCGNFICGYCLRPSADGEYFCPSCFSASGSEHYADLAWENAEHFGGRVAAFFHTIKASLLSPNEFFKTVDPAGGYKEPIYYILICFAFSTFGSLASTAAQFAAMPEDMPIADILNDMPGAFLLGLVGALLLFPLWIIAAQAILAGIIHLCCMIVGAANAGYEGTFRLLSYSAGPNVANGVVSVAIALIGVWHPVLFAIMSMLGGLVQMAVGLYFYVLIALGIRDVHGTTVGRAIGAVAVFFGGILLFTCGCVALWIAAMAGTI